MIAIDWSPMQYVGQATQKSPKLTRLPKNPNPNKTIYLIFAQQNHENRQLTVVVTLTLNMTVSNPNRFISVFTSGVHFCYLLSLIAI